MASSNAAPTTDTPGSDLSNPAQPGPDQCWSSAITTLMSTSAPVPPTLDRLTSRHLDAVPFVGLLYAHLPVDRMDAFPHTDEAVSPSWLRGRHGGDKSTRTSVCRLGSPWLLWFRCRSVACRVLRGEVGEYVSDGGGLRVRELLAE
jgi:hypothetical protein